MTEAETANHVWTEYRYWIRWVRDYRGRLYALTCDGGEALEVKAFAKGWVDCDAVNRYDPAIIRL